MLRTRAIRNTALTVLLPLLFLNASSARALYRRVFDNLARSECCCPPTAEPHAVPHAAVAKACCCDVEQPKVGARAQARLERSEVSQLRAPVAAIAPPRFDLASRWAVVEAQRAVAELDPPIGPPLILRKCSFLI
jgi:hypothetical protein